jgi:predicted nucleic acid-binding protein
MRKRRRMTAACVADTRLLLTLQFPPDKETGEKVRAFVQKELARGIIIVPSIVLAEFVKIAGVRIGVQAAANVINVLKERGMKIRSVDEEVALEAGRLLVRHKNVPFADSLIAAFASNKIAEYVLSDDPHFQILGSKTKWF